MRHEKVWMNGRIIGVEGARISVFDRGFLYGDGLFETMRCYAGIAYKLDEHLERLFSSARGIRIKIPYSMASLRAAIRKIVRVNRVKGAYIRITVTRGEGPFGISHSDGSDPNVIIVAKEFEGYPEWMARRGISAQVVKTRQNEWSSIAHIKSLSFLNYIVAKFEAKGSGADEAIIMNGAGYVAEAATSNVFIVKGKALITPSIDCGILPGITRQVVIEIAHRLKIKINERRISARELFGADEVFLTNSLAEVLPVTRIDSTTIGDGIPGEITRLVHISYQKDVIRSVVGMPR